MRLMKRMLLALSLITSLAGCASVSPPPGAETEDRCVAVTDENGRKVAAEGDSRRCGSRTPSGSSTLWENRTISGSRHD